MSKPVWLLPSLFIFIAAIVTVASAQQNNGPVNLPAKTQQDAPIATTSQNSSPDSSVTGRVEVIDHKTGWVRVKAEERELRLQYPFYQIKDIRKGDIVNVRLADSSHPTIEKISVRKN